MGNVDVGGESGNAPKAGQAAGSPRLSKTGRIKRPRVWRAEINDCPPTANEYMRMHYRVRMAQKSKWYTLIYAAFFHDTPRKATGRRRVRVVVTSKRERDYANLWLAIDKCLLDSLVKLGWLVDDSPKFLTPVVEGKVGEPHTLIEIFGEGKL